MATAKLIPREQWTRYFDDFSKRFLRDDSPEAATVEVLDTSVGDQEMVRGARVIGVTYDHADNLLDLALERVDHLIFHPTEIWVTEEPNGFVREIAVVREDGSREIVHLEHVGLRRQRD